MRLDSETWLPVKWLADEKLLRWMRFDEKPFSEPFFDETITRNRLLFDVNRQKRQSVTTASWLLQHAETAAPPDLLIFHVSRCGSTLLAQMLGADAGMQVLAEVPLLDELLMQAAASPLPENVALVRAAAHLLRRGKQRLIIKTDCWHLLHFSLLRRIWPQVPAVVLYRHPSEILRSHRKLPGIQTIPGYLSAMQLPGINRTLHPDPYFAQLLSAFFNTIIQLKNENAAILPLSYATAPEQLALQTAAYAGIELSEEHHAQLKHRAQFNAKKPGQVFAEHIESAEVPAFLQETVNNYQQLLLRIP
jgi:hypothetical protein